MFETMRRTLRVIRRSENPWRWVFLVLMAAFASGLEMVGALLVFVLVGLVADPGGEIGLPVIGDVRQFAGVVDDESFLLTLLVVLGVFFFLRAVFHVVVVFVQHRAGQRLGAQLSVRLALGYLAMSYEDHVKRNNAQLIHNSSSAVDALVVNAVMPVVRVAADTMIALGLLAVMLAVSRTATLLAILIVGGSQVLLLLGIQPRLKIQGSIVHDTGKRTLRSLQQALYGFRDIRLLGRERYFAGEFATSRFTLADALVRRGTSLAIPPVVMETALVGFILVFFAVAVLTDTATQQVLAVLGLFAYAGLRLQPTLNRVVQGLNEMRFATAMVEEVSEELDLVAGFEPPDPPSGDPLSWSQIVVDDVSFRYSPEAEWALKDISLSIQRGETIGVCGATGGGKSTFVDLVAGLLRPTTGAVRVDGDDLVDLGRRWQAELGVVSQMVFLIDDTIRRNVALGVPDAEIDERGVMAALEMAQMDQFVLGLPDGLDTEVGEQGVRMSGGQRQRIAIARALYRRATLLILDEGTSALDNTTERHFMDALAGLRGEFTMILVAHRLSTVEQCDRIIMLDQGRIVGLGTYKELLAENASFRALAASGSLGE